MRHFRLLLISLFTGMVFYTPTFAQSELLGKISFPNSGSEAAQTDFMEGMLYLHNFEYEDAARSFLKAQQIDPNFAMAYYGEAKSYNHPIWMQQDKEAAVNALSRLGATVYDRQDKAPTQREKDLLMSLEVLYGTVNATRDLSKQERDDAYLEFMAGLHAKYPEDHEITAFYGLAMLGSAHEGRDFAIYMQAAAEMMEIWEANKEHPGAAHYLIHSFDDPTHAPLGLPMARAYSAIAPKAAHAQHMTSHIFLALGMWEDVISANIVARDVQVARQQELSQQPTVCGHYTWWLMYGYLQTDDISQADNVFANCIERIESNTARIAGANYSEQWHYVQMRAHYIIDSENWEMSKTWKLDVDPSSGSGRNYHFTNAYAAVQQGNMQLAEQELDLLRESPETPARNIQIDQLRGLMLVKLEYIDEGLEILNAAVEAENALPIDFGPPEIVKPSLEILGDVYLELCDLENAQEAYELQLKRTPERLLSLEGLKKASS